MLYIFIYCSDTEDSDMKVYKVFLVLDLEIMTQRKGAWEAHKVAGFNKLSANFYPDLQEME